LGSYAVLSIIICAVVIYLFMACQRAAAIWVLAAVGGGVLLSNVLKLAFERPRPDLVPHAARVFTTSFPADMQPCRPSHISRSAPFSRVFVVARFRVYFLGLAILLTIAVGISRIYLGVHYPTDVLAGWCVGAAWAALCWSIFNWLQGRGQIEAPSS
jgi:undecaprenyl-diphosphatase